jgi:hypothetical protein
MLSDSASTLIDVDLMSDDSHGQSSSLRKHQDPNESIRIARVLDRLASSWPLFDPILNLVVQDQESNSLLFVTGLIFNQQF